MGPPAVFHCRAAEAVRGEGKEKIEGLMEGVEEAEDPFDEGIFENDRLQPAVAGVAHPSALEVEIVEFAFDCEAELESGCLTPLPKVFTLRLKNVCNPSVSRVMALGAVS